MIKILKSKNTGYEYSEIFKEGLFNKQFLPKNLFSLDTKSKVSSRLLFNKFIYLIY